jgi:hypothetical protein
MRQLRAPNPRPEGRGPSRYPVARADHTVGWTASLYPLSYNAKFWHFARRLFWSGTSELRLANLPRFRQGHTWPTTTR